jgi:hypothetical protein
MAYDFLVDTYATERMKVISVWSGVVNLFVLISSGANRGTREGSLRTHAALRQPSLCL